MTSFGHALWLQLNLFLFEIRGMGAIRFLFLLLPLIADAADFHVSPACWKESRVFQEPFNESYEDKFVVKGSSKRRLEDQVISPNKAYWFHVAPFHPDDLRQTAPVSIYVFTEQDYLLEIRIDEVKYRPPQVRWINEKLLYIEPWWGIALGSQVIVDVESEKIIWKEMVQPGSGAMMQFKAACMEDQFRDSPSCQCADSDKHAVDSVRYLEPLQIGALPQAIRKDLSDRGCRIPQSYESREPHNFIEGHFRNSSQTDWAVLCSARNSSAILVYWNGVSTDVETVGAYFSDSNWMQGIGDGKVGYSRKIGAVDRAYIEKREAAYGAPTSPIDHEGIDDGFVGKASTVRFWYKGEWIELTGAD